MKIKFVKCYQAVEFGKGRTNELSFLASEYHSTSAFTKAPKVTFEEKDKGILVYNDEDAILVGWANIAYLKYDRSQKTEVKPLAKAK